MLYNWVASPIFNFVARYGHLPELRATKGEDNTIQHGPVADVGNNDDNEGAAPGTRVLATVKLAKTLFK